MQAIQVKTLSATDHKGTRIKAWSYSGISITRGRNYEYDIDKDMANVAGELAKKLEWSGEFRGGTLPNGEMVWVIGSENYFSVEG